MGFSQIGAKMETRCKVCARELDRFEADGQPPEEAPLTGACWVLVCQDCSKTLSSDAPPIPKLLTIIGRLFRRGGARSL